MADDRKSTTNSARGKRPVTWHPLFPAIVAVWFGALFGLGALAVRVSLLERVAMASGIDRLIPAAAPPLGVNARVLIALALALLGGVIGVVIGRLVARSKPNARGRREVVGAEAGEVTDTAPVWAAPPAEQTPSFIDISQLDLDHQHKIETPRAADVAVAAPERVSGFERPLAPVSFPLPASFPVPGGAAAERLNAADLDSLSHVELIERLALSLQKRREEAGEAGHEVPPEEGADATMPPAPSGYPPASEPIARRFPGISGEAGTEPIALFPEQNAAPGAALRQGSVATERALREALTALQRMSGAA